MTCLEVAWKNRWCTSTLSSSYATSSTSVSGRTRMSLSTGASLQKTPSGGWRLNHSEYLKKVKPIALHRGRGPEDYMTPAETTQLRGLLGSLQWPSVQSQPHLQCSTSLLAGQLSAGLVKSIQDANRLLKFAKLNSDVSLCYEHLCCLEDLRLVTMVDAAFGIRRDGSSQGGYLMMHAGSQNYV